MSKLNDKNDFIKHEVCNYVIFKFLGNDYLPKLNFVCKRFYELVSSYMLRHKIFCNLNN